MRSVTLSSPEDKNLVRKAVPTSKIFTAGVARLHVASPDPSKWTYSQVWGAAIFCIDKAKNNSFFIRLVDIQNNSGVIWEQELYVGFNYIKDASYFHSFETDDCLTALEFVDEGEADVFYKKVQGRDSLSAKATAPTTESINNSGFGHRKTPSFSNTLKKRKSKIDKNHIGMPADFKHVGHIGYTPGKGFSVQNNDPEWNGIFDQLKELGISADEISDNQAFIQDFLQQNGTTLPSSPPPNQFQQRQQQQQQREIPITTAPPPIQTSRKKAPPPPPPPGRHHAPPPPPPPRRSNNNQSSPPPPPPARHPGPPVPNRGRPVPTPPPSMGGGFAPNPPQPPMGGVPPPPPPPPQPSMGGIPPPPPPPMMNSGNAPPPPPQMGSPPPPSGGDGRSDLMASIRSAGGFGTLKSSGKLREAEKSAPPTTSMTNQAASTATGAAAGAAGGNLASSLADVLKQRKQAMQSDDEDEDDDEWE